MRAAAILLRERRRGIEPCGANGAVQRRAALQPPHRHSARATPQGHTCFVPLPNALLGLGMYASYFVLFLQLFLSHYVYRATKKKPTNIAVGQASVATMGGKPSPSSSPIMSSTPGKPLKAD